MKERVYLGDWFYNAGIVGFLKGDCPLNCVNDKLSIKHRMWTDGKGEEGTKA
jgi:hypothetical protein